MELNLQSTLQTCISSKIALIQIKLAVLNQTYSLDELMKMATDLNYLSHHKALRIVELITEDHSISIKNHIPKLLEVAPKYKHCSAVRGISRILYFVVLTPEIKLSDMQKEALIDTALDWFISNEKVACKVNALKL